MKKLLAMGTLALLSGVVGRGETHEPQVGEDPPPLGLERILQAPSGTQASWASLKGKVIVLEFWATWCGPCIAAIPHLNEMADQFKDQPLQFIAITDENDAVVAPFLKKKPMHAWVGLDTDRSMFTAYGITGIPHTVVVDQEGRIAAITHPSSLSAQHLKDVLAGRKLALARPGSGNGIRADQVPASARPEAELLFQVLIRPTEATKVIFTSNPGTGNKNLRRNSGRHCPGYVRHRNGRTCIQTSKSSHPLNLAGAARCSSRRQVSVRALQCFVFRIPLKKVPGEGTGPAIHTDIRGNPVGRVPSRSERDIFEQAVRRRWFDLAGRASRV